MIGDRIKNARVALGYSAEQVAAFLHISPATVYRYEKGDISKLPAKFIKPLANFLCVTPEYLMEWDSENAPVVPISSLSPEEAHLLSVYNGAEESARHFALEILENHQIVNTRISKSSF